MNSLKVTSAAPLDGYQSQRVALVCCGGYITGN